jgi:enamine deaminase RidA (YjgF/YER057c/UK114 family)
MSIQRLKAGARMSQAVIHGDTVYLAGQVADDTGADAAGQTRQILAKIDALLAEAGSSRDRLLSAVGWLADVADYDCFYVVWDAWVTPGSPPARACVGARLAGPEYRIEIGAVAAR